MHSNIPSRWWSNREYIKNILNKKSSTPVQTPGISRIRGIFHLYHTLCLCLSPSGIRCARLPCSSETMNATPHCVHSAVDIILLLYRRYSTSSLAIEKSVYSINAKHQVVVYRNPGGSIQQPTSTEPHTHRMTFYLFYIRGSIYKRPEDV